MQKNISYEESIYHFSELVRHDVGKHGLKGSGSYNLIASRLETG